MQCSKCPTINCSKKDLENAPKGCPSVDFKDVYAEAKKEYEKPEVRKISQAAAHVEVTGYMKWPRVQELMVFANKMGYKKSGGYMKKMAKGGKTGKYNCSHNRLY